MKDKVWSLGHLDLFKGLSEKSVENIEDLLFMKKYPKNEVIFDPSDCCNVYIIKSGRVEIYHLTPDGKKVIIDVLQPGSVFADLGGALNSGVFVETIEESYICSAEKGIFFRNISKEPEVAERLMQHLFNRVVKLEEKASSLAVDNVEHKFLKLLLSLGRQDDMNASKYITDKYTHEQLAQMIGVSRQTLTSVINELERNDIIVREKKQFIFDKDTIQAELN